MQLHCSFYELNSNLASTEKEIFHLSPNFTFNVIFGSESKNKQPGFET